jgi:hypothetical protein
MVLVTSNSAYNQFVWLVEAKLQVRHRKQTWVIFDLVKQTIFLKCARKIIVLLPAIIEE